MINREEKDIKITYWTILVLAFLFVSFNELIFNFLVG